MNHKIKWEIFEIKKNVVPKEATLKEYDRELTLLNYFTIYFIYFIILKSLSTIKKLNYTS